MGTETLAYTIPEAAHVARVSIRFLYHEIAKGHLKTVKIGRRRLVRNEALREWLQAHEVA